VKFISVLDFILGLLTKESIEKIMLVSVPHSSSGPSLANSISVKEPGL
jgi:hypothetical protein